MQTKREQLQQEFIELRNAKVTKGKCARTRRIYFDHLNDSEQLAAMKTDEELQDAIDKMREIVK